MRRRDFIKVIAGSTAVWPLTAHAQQNVKLRRVGILHPRNADDLGISSLLAVFRNQLQHLGWRENSSIEYNQRAAGGNAELLRTYATELVKLSLDVYLAEGTPAVAQLQKATRTTPIVFVNAQNPVGSGFAASMARPGGNITGFVSFVPEMGGKWTEILRELAPNISRIALVHNPRTHTGQYTQSAHAAAQTFGIAAVAVPFDSAADIEREIEKFAREPNGGLLVLPDTSTNFHRELIPALAIRHKLPAVYAFRHFIGHGGLAYFGTDHDNLYRQAASYVDRILRGEKPGDLPVQAPTKFELVINLRTAKALGLTVPPTLLARADEVIE